MSLSFDDVVTILVKYISNHQHEREEGAELLKNSELLPGFLSAACQIISRHEDIPVAIRLAASIRLKRISERYWPLDRRSKADRLSPQDRASVHEYAVHLLLNETNEAIRNQLSDAVTIVGRLDYPQKWPNAADPIVKCLEEQNQQITDSNRVYNAFIALHSLSRLRRSLMHIPEHRVVQDALLSSSMPYVANILQLLLSSEDAALQSQDMSSIRFIHQTSHLGMKMISHHLTLVAPQWYRVVTNVNLITRLISTCAAACPLQFMTDLYQDEDERAYQHSVHKRRKWALRILNRLVRQLLKGKENKESIKTQLQWNKGWIKAYRDNVYDLAITILSEAKHSRATTSDTCLAVAIRILQNCASVKTAFKSKIIPNLPQLFDVTLHILAYSPSELESWTDTPIDFLNTILSSNDESRNYKDHLTELLETIFKHPECTSLCVDHLLLAPVNAYSNAIEAQATHGQQLSQEQLLELTLRRDVALRIFSSLSDILGTPTFIQSTLNLLLKISNEDLSENLSLWGQLPILPFRVFTCYAKYYKPLNLCLQQSEYAHAAQHLLEFIVNKLLTVLHPSADCASIFNSEHYLVLRVQASYTLNYLLNIPQVRNLVRPFAQHLFVRVFELADKFETEATGLLFQQLIVHFEDQIGPVAEAILQSLVPKFLHILQGDARNDINVENGLDYGDYDDYDDEAEEKLFAAHTYLSSMQTIVNGIKDDHQLLQKCEPLLLQICTAVLDTFSEDYVQGAMDVLQAVIYYSPSISEAVWSLYPKLINMVVAGWGESSYEDILPSLANYMTRNIHDFLSRSCIYHDEDTSTQVQKSCIDLLFMLFNRAYTSTESHMHADQEYSTHLLRTLLGWIPNDIAQETLQQFFQQSLSIIFQQLTALQGSNRHKYIGLLLDCIWMLVYRFPTTIIPSLVSNTPSAFLDGNASSAPSPSSSCLIFCINAFMTSCDSMKRVDSISAAITGLSTILALVSSVEPNGACSVPQVDALPDKGSNLRGLIITTLLSAGARLKIVEEEEDDSDDEDEDDEGLYNDDDDDDDDITDETVERQAQEMDQQIQQYAQLAKQLRETNDIYYNDFDFETPIDHDNCYETFLAGLQQWSSSTIARIPEEVQLLEMFRNREHPGHEMIASVIVYMSQSAKEFHENATENDGESE